MCLEAGPHDPWVGVHVMTEFMFCPRAGIMEYERNLEDQGEEEDVQPANVDFVPLYDLKAINRKINDLSDQLCRLRQSVFKLKATVGVVCLAVAPTLALIGKEHLCGPNQGVGFGLLTGAVFSTFLTAIFLLNFGKCARNELMSKIAALANIQRFAAEALPKEPPHNLQENYAVDWWELLRADFESIAYKDSLCYPAWRLAGRPWRVLRRGSLRIPVFKKKSRNNSSDRRLFRQHYARIAAYCNLLQACENAESPYGIVLFDDTFEGVAIPRDTAGSWAALTAGLNTARKHIRCLKEFKQDPSPPGGDRICRGCHLGRPLVHRVGASEHTRLGTQLTVICATGEDGRDYHSACGDRFRWVPPHDKAIDKGLTNQNKHFDGVE